MVVVLLFFVFVHFAFSAYDDVNNIGKVKRRQRAWVVAFLKCRSSSLSAFTFITLVVVHNEKLCYYFRFHTMSIYFRISPNCKLTQPLMFSMIKRKLMNDFQVKELIISSNEYNASNFRKISSQKSVFKTCYDYRNDIRWKIAFESVLFQLN